MGNFARRRDAAGRRGINRSLSIVALACALAPTAHAQDAAGSLSLSPTELFMLADRARAGGEFALAEQAYRALSGNPDLEIRTEARFRLGMMLADDVKRCSDAVIEFRRILDDKPDAARVRIELARMQARSIRPDRIRSHWARGR